jgi:hypothetical protein
MITDPIELHTAVSEFLYEIPEDGPCGLKHVVKYDTCHNKGHANIVETKVFVIISLMVAQQDVPTKD